MTNEDNYYNILGVTKNSTQDEIKQSYKKLAKEYHPDKNVGVDTTEKFQKIQTVVKMGLLALPLRFFADVRYLLTLSLYDSNSHTKANCLNILNLCGFPA